MSGKIAFGSENVKSLYVGAQKVKKIYAGSELVYESTPATPTVPSDAIIFYALNSFTLKVLPLVGSPTKSWDGALYYSTDYTSWTEWDGTTEISSSQNNNWHTIYLRGIGNTVITTNNPANTFRLTGTAIKCEGNMDNLLDYTTIPTTIGNSAFRRMFANNRDVDFDVTLPRTTLAPYCYANMFNGCTSMTKAPSLPATVLADHCYLHMFASSSITSLPTLNATSLANNCYDSMARTCNNLVDIPSLPATVLASQCYQYMFEDCANLEKLPQIYALTGASKAFYRMFRNCSKIKMSETQTGTYQNSYRVPPIGTITDDTDMCLDMFANTGGTYTGDGKINNNVLYTSNQIIT